MTGATTRRRAVTSAVLAVLLIAAAGSTSAPASHPDRVVRDLDLVASANPSAAEPVVIDDAFASDASFRRTVKSDVAATGSATCDGCEAASTALQILYVGRGREARLDNTATAWTQACTGCLATALSVQVVVLRGVSSIVPNNRALAVNAACASCQATGVAFQLVVSSRRADRLSGDARAALRRWVARQAEVLRIPDPATQPADPTTTPGSAPPSSAPTETPTSTATDDTTVEPPPTARRAQTKADRRARRAASSALGTLEDLVTDDLGAVTVSADVQLSR